MENPTRDDTEFDLATLVKLIAEAKFAMLTTRAPGGSLRSRPLTTLDTDLSGVLWFLVPADSELAREIEDSPRVNLSYANTSDGRFLSVSGPAQVGRDRARAAELWSPVFAVWSSGPDDPNLAVLRVAAEQVEYWDSPFTPIGRLVGFVKALATGHDSALGTHKRAQIDSPSTAGNTSTEPGNVYGEGNYAASREYNQATRDFVRSGRVEDAAAAAAPADADEAAELRDAEAQGKSRAKDEDPEIARPARRR